MAGFVLTLSTLTIGCEKNRYEFSSDRYLAGSSPAHDGRLSSTEAPRYIVSSTERLLASTSSSSSFSSETDYSFYLIAIKPYITSEFARKPRDLSEVDRWKATEFRQFLLYTGIVIMKSVLSKNCYNHFISLSVAIRILTDPQLCITCNAYAKSLLVWFVSNYGILYRDEYISYNVHNLIHFPDEVQTFGCLDNFSCFKFENHMQKIKKKVRQSRKPLEQLSNCVFEELQLPIQPCPIIQYPVVVYKKNKEISYLQFKSFKISKHNNNNFALLDSNFVVCILDIVEENCVLYIRAQRYLNPKSFFSIPCPSEKLGIFLIYNTTNSDIIKIPVTQIYKKCIKILLFDEVESFVTIPLLLSNN
ncbi:uncharacterized protein [Temnothorax nylanderi]|uniref:uncharacterized protein n=1 Tax=Temnothorax nylanderi TaxID=102681 RepID=UPI003A895E4B